MSPARSLVLLLAACSSPGLRPDGEAFVAELPAARVRLDRAGLHVDAGLTLRTVNVGRAAALEPADLSAPAAAGCWPGAPWSPPAACLSAAERPIPGGVERWMVDGSAVHQGWTVAAPPPGEGPLLLDVEIAGAALSLRGGALHLAGDDGRPWRYDQLAAWDADDRRLPAWLTLRGDRVRVHVDDRGARWPVHIDPVLSTASDTFVGPDGSDFGIGLDMRGDANSDGYADLLVGARFGVDLYGAWYSYLGGPDGLTLAASQISPDVYTSLGERVSSGGDVNGDGYDDAIVAEFFADRVQLLLGGPGGFASVPDQTVPGGFGFGHRAVLAPDLHGDGYDDVVVSTNGDLELSVFRGGPGGIVTPPELVLSGVADDLAGLGDVDGDGRGDFVVSGEGRVRVFLGRAGPPVEQGELVGDDAPIGVTAAPAGDLNGDGYADLITGAPDDADGVGRAWVFFGSPAGLGSPVALAPPADIQGFGFTVAGAGDVNGDGFDDVVAGANNNSGRWWLFHGYAGGVRTTPASRRETEYVMFNASAGDVNGDGYDDLAVADWPQRTVWVLYGCADSDSDGFCADLDCDDADPARHPDAAEVCGGGDEDCDGLVDEADDSLDPDTQLTVWTDRDADSWGDDTTEARACSATGFATRAGDCDDDRPLVHPEAQEVCGGGDEDCDGLDDDADPSVDPATQGFYWPDADRDGAGDGAAEAVALCDASVAFTGNSSDCNDANPEVRPGGAERCDTLDNDCDGAIDDADPSVDLATATRWFFDGDTDGWGSATEVLACAAPPDFISTDGDCDDTQPSVFPGAEERCDAVDNDCDGALDAADPGIEPSDLVEVWADRDADGWGEASGRRCGVEAGFAARPGDCDDLNPRVNPEALESCNAGDEDCDGLTEDADPSVNPASQGFYWPDADADGLGDETAEAELWCTPPGAYVGNANDCDDRRQGVRPGATELCNGVDDDCDRLLDDADPGVDLTGASIWYFDGDTDGWGGTNQTVACAAPPDFVARGGDCDEARGDVFPGAPSACDARDWDCDGLTAEADPDHAALVIPLRRDDDRDGFGGQPGGSACPGLVPDGAVPDGGPPDCDDTSARVNPGADELPFSGVDEDCDGTEICHRDDDRDGFGGVGSVRSPDIGCASLGVSLGADDCDDAAAGVYPGAAELPANDRDDDCDGLVLCAVDSDGDGVGGAAAAAETETCGVPGLSPDAGDCDDADPFVRPNVVDLPGTGVDEDCDGVELCFLDADDDGWRVEATAPSADADCDDPGEARSTDPGLDCDDAAANAYPGATEQWYDGIDGDCNGGSDHDADLDGVDRGADCDDNNPDVLPGATDAWYDGVDSDCDGASDFDADGDGYDSDAYGGEDCDDAAAAIAPGQPELADGLDNDCDGHDETWDGDADALTDLEEGELGTDPDDADSDDDGLQDGDEVTRGTDPLVVDSDGGSVGDGEEVEAGTDPLDAGDDVPEVSEKDDVEPAGCGCDSSGGAWGVALLGVVVVRRRGRRGR